jgi:hypothetical protein
LISYPAKIVPASVERIIYLLRTPVIVSVPVFWHLGWADGPDVQTAAELLFGDVNWLEYASTNARGDGWHAIAIHGYDRERRVFEFKNSWDIDWGLSGHGTITYEYLVNYCDLAMYGVA